MLDLYSNCFMVYYIKKITYMYVYVYFKLLSSFAPCSSCASTASKGSNPAFTEIKVKCFKCNCTNMLNIIYYATSWKGGQSRKFLYNMNESDFSVHITRYIPALVPAHHD